MGLHKCNKCGGKVKVDERGTPEYMLTYGDMMTLLLTFFVLLLSFSEINVKKFQLVLSSFQNAIGFFQGGKTINLSNEELINAGQTRHPLGKSTKIPKPKREQAKVYGWLEKRLGQVELRTEERGIIIQISDETLFEPGSIELKPSSIKLLDNIAYFLNEIVPDNDVRIEGHTDDIPVSGEVKDRFRSNIELSAIRSANVFHYLVKEGLTSADRFSISGYGSYHPLKKRKDETVEEWRAKNRRVDIVILRGLSEEAMEE